MKDFTIKNYESLIKALLLQNYQFLTLEEYSNHNDLNIRIIVMRHDVDSWPSNALKMARIEHEMRVKATYYFRMHRQSYNEKIIQEIAALGHEIGYHYEDLANTNGNYEKAFEEFKVNLEKLRKLYLVKTISMHGRPLSKWDSRDLWNKYDYKSLGLVCEPYLDIDYSKVLYLKDTGGCWDGNKFSIRDSVTSGFNFQIHSTQDLIEHIGENKLPKQIILNVHPARWNDNMLKWIVRQFVLTYPKRGIKQLIKQIREKRNNKI